jgi:hypothetical protein
VIREQAHKELEGAFLTGPSSYDDAPVELKPIAPPAHASYLDDAPQIPDELLAGLHGNRRRLPKSVDERAQATIGTIAAEIRFRREAYERANGVVIVSEPITMPRF